MEVPVAGGANRNGPVWIFIEYQMTIGLTPGDPSVTTVKSGITPACMGRVVRNHRDPMHRVKGQLPISHSSHFRS